MALLLHLEHMTNARVRGFRCGSLQRPNDQPGVVPSLCPVLPLGEDSTFLGFVDALLEVSTLVILGL